MVGNSVAESLLPCSMLVSKANVYWDQDKNKSEHDNLGPANSWKMSIIRTCTALNVSPHIDCCWAGGSTQNAY